MIQTLDFFTPVVDDPYLFGQIAAANSLSDVYAMGGEPKVALNIVCFPNCLDPEILGEILRGGADKVLEAGAVLVGGHSVQDDEPKYGLSVTGFVHPDKIYKNYGCQPGDVLVLTKQLGSGIVNTTVKAQMASEAAADEAAKVMASLNQRLDAGDIEEVYLDLISDPQTSGGLLVSVPREELDCLLADFEAVGMETKVSVVGCVKERQEKLIQLKKGKMEML